MSKRTAYNNAMVRLNEIAARYADGSRSARIGTEHPGVDEELDLLLTYGMIVAIPAEVDEIGDVYILEPTPEGAKQIKSCRRAWTKEIEDAVQAMEASDG